MSRVKTRLKQLNNCEFKNVRVKVEDLRNQLNKILEKIHDHTILEFHRQQEQDLRKQLEKWSLIEESAMQQKSRAQWLKLGDVNTSYFFAHMKNRISQNSITSLVNVEGVRAHTKEDIE